MEPNFFDKLNQAEPFVAIRFLILQAGIALGLYWTGVATGQVPEDLNLFPLNLMGVFNTDQVLEFGYPMREVIWSGEWWRLLIGIFLPPGLGWFAFSVIALLPLGKMMEEETGRLASLFIYIMGGVVVVLVDHTTTAMITAGSLGMVFAAGGAVLVKLGFDRREGPERLAVVPGGTWMALLLLWVFSWTLSYAPMYRPSIEFADITQIGPTQKGLIAALFMGAACSLPIHLFQRLSFHSLDQDFHHPKRGFLTGVLCLIPLTGIAGIAGYCCYEWNRTGRVDYLLWREDPFLQQGDPQAQQRIEELIQAYPDDLFLAKRLAISYAYNRQFPQASVILEDIFSKVSPQEKDKGQGHTKDFNRKIQSSYLERRFRVTALNHRSMDETAPWRRSGFAGNYDADPLRILWDQGHVACLSGATPELKELREQLFRVFDSVISRQVSETDEDPSLSKERQAVELNHRAYVNCELGGDLASAIQDASRSVSLLPSGDNLDTLGWCEVKRNQLDTGIAHLERALLYDELHSAGTIHFHLGMAFHLKGDSGQANQHWMQALKYDIDWWDELTLQEACPDCLKREASLTGKEIMFQERSDLKTGVTVEKDVKAP